MPTEYAPDHRFVLRLIVGCDTIHGGAISVDYDLHFHLVFEPYPPAPLRIRAYYNTTKLLVSRVFPTRLQGALAFRTMHSRVGGGEPRCVAAQRYVSQRTGAVVTESGSDVSVDTVAPRTTLRYTVSYRRESDADRARVVALQQIWRLQQLPKYAALDAVRHVPGLTVIATHTAFLASIDQYESVATNALVDFSAHMLKDVVNKQDNLLYAELALRRVLRTRCGVPKISSCHWLFPTEEPSLKGVAEKISDIE